jgi:hypothetical protein
VATVGKGHDFTCGRQFCAWLGLVPGQYSSGGKQRLGRITKAGDPYLRTLLILGGKAVLVGSEKQDRSGEPLGNFSTGTTRLLESRGGYRGQECAYVLGDVAAGARRSRCLHNQQHHAICFVIEVVDVTV